MINDKNKLPSSFFVCTGNMFANKSYWFALNPSRIVLGEKVKFISCHNIVMWLSVDRRFI